MSQIDDNRRINVEHDDWWEYIEEEWRQKMKDVGIYMDILYFSGFSSQGDGACFNGSLEDEVAFLEAHATPDEYPMIRDCHKADCAMYSATWHNEGRYMHSNTLRFSVQYNDFTYCMAHVYDLPVLEDMGITHFEKAFEKEQSDLESLIKEVVKGYCDDIYRELEAEYYGLTSDEAVMDTMKANGLWEDEENEDD